MKIGSVAASAAISLAILATNATKSHAATIILHNIGGVTPGSAAAIGFEAAAAYWARTLTNNVTIELDVGYEHLGADVLGQTSSNYTLATVGSVEQQLIANGNSSLDAIAASHLPTVDSTGSISMITSGFQDPANHLGTDTSYQVFDNNQSINNQILGMPSANAKALGFAVPAGTIDAQIQFSSDFAFDFNPTDGISPGTIDFVGVATHEIGHALGFVSGVDGYDYIGAPHGDGAADYATYPVEDDWWGSTLDLYRYSKNPNGFAGGGPLLDWSVGTASYFSIDGGATALDNGYFSTGAFNGDGNQASHWKDNTYSAGTPCLGHTTALGIMDPTFAYCEGGVVTALDLAAFDAIGWNTSVDPLKDASYTMTTARIYSAIPEPSEWTLMIAGLGLAGLALRRRRMTAA